MNECDIYRPVANISCVQKSAYCVISICRRLQTVMKEMGHFKVSLNG
jgi:hypothetical protein